MCRIVPGDEVVGRTEDWIAGEVIVDVAVEGSAGC